MITGPSLPGCYPRIQRALNPVGQTRPALFALEIVGVEARLRANSICVRTFRQLTTKLLLF